MENQNICRNCNMNNRENGNNLYVSGSPTTQAINISNNRSRYYAELAESYKNSAREYCENARYYAEQNSDVTLEYVTSIQANLQNQIDGKQNSGNYVTETDLTEDLLLKQNVLTAGDNISINADTISVTGLNLKANTAMDNLLSAGLSKLNQSKALITGDVSTDSDVLADIKNYAKSTFDLTKFTVVGSPNITDDGIASGFSSNNRITILNVPTFDKPFKVCFKVKTGDLSSGQTAFYSNGGTYYNAISTYGGTNPRFQVSLRLSDESTPTFPAVTGVESFTEYTGCFSWTGTEYRLHIDGLTDWAYQSSLALSTASNTTVKLGCLYTNELHFNGSIDLKQFSITVDGVEVFSGNKTGIDTIKPDNYTVVGTPTISADGVASGFSSSNYIKTSSINLSSANSWEVVMLCGAGARGYAMGGNVLNTIAITANGKMWISSNGTSWDIASEAGDVTSPNVEHLLRVRFTGTEYITDYSLDNGNSWTEVANVSSTTKVTSALTSLILGTIIGSGGLGNTGSIDLNSFKIYVDGDLVYQPCLKIPYTVSKTGSKVVDAVYRNRVTDMYEQYGYAPYYTLSDTDFTLPMGEIYGIIGKGLSTKCNVDGTNATFPHIIKTFVDGASWYRVWADGWCEQGGLTDASTSSQQITFLKAFKNTNYSVSLTPLKNENSAGGTANCPELAHITDGYTFGKSETGMYISQYNQATRKTSWITFGYLASGQY